MPCLRVAWGAQTLNMLCVFEQGGAECEAFKRHVGRIDDYLWLAEDGMKMQVRHTPHTSIHLEACRPTCTWGHGTQCLDGFLSSSGWGLTA